MSGHEGTIYEMIGNERKNYEDFLFLGMAYLKRNDVS
jgi:hypothetical protein